MSGRMCVINRYLLVIAYYTAFGTMVWIRSAGMNNEKSFPSPRFDDSQDSKYQIASTVLGIPAVNKRLIAYNSTNVYVFIYLGVITNRSILGKKELFIIWSK